MHIPNSPNDFDPPRPKQTLRALGWLVGALAAVFAIGSESFAPTIRADDDTPTEAASDTELRPAGEYLPETVRRLRRAGTIDTDIVQTVHFGSRSTEAKGHYTQGPTLKSRLEYHVKLGRVEGELLQVCDGEDLWTQYTVGEDVRLTLRKVGEIVSAARRGGLTSERIMTAELGLGGLPGMLAAIDDATDFQEVEVETVGETKLFVVRGPWAEKFRTSFGQAPGLEPFTPDLVEVSLDSSYFPRRIRYLKENDGTRQRLVTLEFRNSKIGGEVDPKLFEFTPPTGVFPKNITDQYLERLQAK